MADKLFSQGGDVAPTLTDRVASGKEGKNAVNSSWSTIVTWLETALGFLKITSNLSDLNNAADARTNLDVYSKGEANSLLGDKADKTNVLQKDNTTTYTPTSSYNPSTMKYTDEGGLRVGHTLCTNVSSDLSGDTAIYANRTGVFVNITGVLKFDSDGTEGDLIITLPSTFPFFTQDCEILFGNATVDEINELYAKAGTRGLYLRNGNVSTNSRGIGSASVPIL